METIPPERGLCAIGEYRMTRPARSEPWAPCLVRCPHCILMSSTVSAGSPGSALYIVAPICIGRRAEVSSTTVSLWCSLLAEHSLDDREQLCSGERFAQERGRIRRALEVSGRHHHHGAGGTCRLCFEAGQQLEAVAARHT